MHQICDGYNPRVRMGISFSIQATGLKNPTRSISHQEQTLKNSAEMQKLISATSMLTSN